MLKAKDGGRVQRINWFYSGSISGRERVSLLLLLLYVFFSLRSCGYSSMQYNSSL